MASVAGKKLEGLVAATFTPFGPGGRDINQSVIRPYIFYLAEKQGVKNIFVNGTTGESMSLTVAERKFLAEEWCKKSKGILDQVIVHVGCMNIKDSQDLAKHAEEIKADAIAVIAPSFFKPRTADDLRAYLCEVASVVPEMPFYYYHLPAVTGVNVKVRDLIKGIEESIPSFRGVKFSATDLLDLGQCISASHDDWSILYGVDEQLLAALPFGVDGAVGSTYNYLGCHASKLISAFKAGDLSQARNIQLKIQELLSFAMELGFDVGVNKKLMADVSGLYLGPPRLPIRPCPHDHSEQIIKKYHEIFPEC